MDGVHWVDRVHPDSLCLPERTGGDPDPEGAPGPRNLTKTGRGGDARRATTSLWGTTGAAGGLSGVGLRELTVFCNAGVVGRLLNPLHRESEEPPPFVLRQIGTTSRRQRFFKFSEGWILVLHRLPGAGAGEERRSVYRYAEGDGPVVHDPEGLSLEEVLGEYRDRLESFEDRLEEALSLSELIEERRMLFPVGRALRNACRAIEDAEIGLLGRRLFLVSRELASELLRKLEILESDLAADIETLQSELAAAHARATEKLEAKNRYLNTLVALFLPLTALTSAFGMNFASGMSTENPWNFWLVILAGVLGSLGLAWWLRRRF